MRKSKKKAIEVKVIEISCYVAGAGAFGVFFRWLQDQMAFTEEGLADASAFNVIVPAFIIIAALYFSHYVDRMRNSRYFLREDFCLALKNEGKLYTVARWAAGAIMIAGGAVLLMTCEVEKQAALMRVVALLAIASGISYPIHLGAANYDEVDRPRLLCLLSILPVIMYAAWLLLSYKQNDINSVVWAYAVEIVAIIAAMLAFFRVAGFAFGNPQPFRCMFACMFGTSMCIMAMADERNFGLQMILAASAVMLLLTNWIMISNLERKAAPSIYAPDDGFERLR